MRLHPGSAVFLLVMAGLLLHAPGHATTVLPLSTEELVVASPTIIHGTVVSTRSHWNDDHTMIVTEVSFRVESTLRGPDSRLITVTQPGGAVGKLRTEIPGASQFLSGEEMVLFARPDQQGRLYPTGLDQGCFRVTADSKSGAKVVRRVARLDPGPDRLAPNNAGAPGVTAPAPISDLDTFLTEIRGMVSRVDVKGGR